MRPWVDEIPVGDLGGSFGLKHCRKSLGQPLHAANEDNDGVVSGVVVFEMELPPIRSLVGETEDKVLGDMVKESATGVEFWGGQKL